MWGLTSHVRVQNTYQIEHTCRTDKAQRTDNQSGGINNNYWGGTGRTCLHNIRTTKNNNVRVIIVYATNRNAHILSFSLAVSSSQDQGCCGGRILSLSLAAASSLLERREAASSSAAALSAMGTPAAFSTAALTATSDFAAAFSTAAWLGAGSGSRLKLGLGLGLGLG